MLENEKKWGEELSCSKWFSWKGNAAYRKALTCKSKAEVRNIGESLLKLDKIRK